MRATAHLSLPCLFLGLIRASYRPFCSSHIHMQYIQTSLSWWWTAKMLCGFLISFSLLSLKNDFFIIHDTEKLIWSATAVTPERLLFTVTMAVDRNIMICYLSIQMSDEMTNAYWMGYLKRSLIKKNTTYVEYLYQSNLNQTKTLINETKWNNDNQLWWSVITGLLWHELGKKQKWDNLLHFKMFHNYRLKKLKLWITS